MGLGSIGKRHARNLLDEGHTVAAMDPNVAAYEGIPLYPNWEAAWGFGPDMVWVCSPTRLHAEQAVAAIQRGSHVFIEKPIAHDLEGAESIKKAWKEAGGKRLVWVGCNLRYHPGAERIKRAFEEGLVGRCLLIRIHFSHFLPNMRPGVDYRCTYAAQAAQGGGIILDDIHDIDLALWLAGPVQKVSALAIRSGTLEMDVEDAAHLSLLHRSGTLTGIHMDFLRRDKSRGVEIIGEKGSLEWRSEGKNPERCSVRWIPAGRAPEILWSAELERLDEMFLVQLREMLAAVADPGIYRKRLDEGIEALEIALEAREPK